MRTLLAPGRKGSPIRVLANAAEGCDGGSVRVIFARIQPAPAEGDFEAGRTDADGLGLHLRYTIAGDDGVPHVTYPGVRELDSSRELVVDFGPGTHYLNYPGDVVLVGGEGLWLVDLQVVRVRAPSPHWHWLLRKVKAEWSFAMPHGHTVIGCYDGTATLRVDSVALQAGATPVPAAGDIYVKATPDPANAVWLFSGFFG